MDIKPLEEGAEPDPAEEEIKAKELKIYEEFAVSHRTSIEACANDLQEFRWLQSELKDKPKPLWPVELTKEEIAARQ